MKTGKNTNLKMHIVDINPTKDSGNFGRLRDHIDVQKAQKYDLIEKANKTNLSKMYKC